MITYKLHYRSSRVCRSVLLSGTTKHLMIFVKICWNICILVRP